jgi:chemotaxis protein methyltransferase CheR
MINSNSVGKREFAFPAASFQEIATLMKVQTGISFDESKSALVYSRLTKRLRALGMESFEQYCMLIKSSDGAAELSHMTDALTTNVTKFFREPHHFEHFKKNCLPRLISKARAGDRVRIWSAGCSSGQEPYSIALTILSTLPDARAYDIKILGTDISSRVLNIARQGVYPLDEILGIPQDLKRSWVDVASDSFEFDEAAKRLIEFKHLNLIERWPLRGPFDVIFCRNVMIYFNDELQDQIWRKMIPLLVPNGALYIGHSERVSGSAAQLLTLDGITTYRMKMKAAA